MTVDYSVQTCRELAQQFRAADLHRPLRINRYDPGDELTYDVTGVVPAHDATVRVVVEKFVGGGFAGQVYRVKVREIQSPTGAIPGLAPDAVLALKILIPPSRFSLFFRNLVYAIGFQGPFQLQTNPTAARAGALWQKFIRRGAAIRFGNEDVVNDVLATFVDHELGSCGELSPWIDGRTWRLEVDDRLDLLKRWRQGRQTDTSSLGSPEYRAKHKFMHDFVDLLHEMGAPEFARQYEWSTCKSQPNCLKRRTSEPDPEAGLVAVDFRAGLALLPFLPMSPGDFKLIGKGIARGSLVQFDRGSLEQLQQFMDAHPAQFTDTHEAFDQLQQSEQVYRNSLPDITHNHVRLLYSPKLWSTMFNSAVTGWRVRNIVDDPAAKLLRHSRLKTIVFFLVGIVPLLGRLVRRITGRTDYRRHYGAMLSSWSYFRRSLRGHIAEKLIVWHRTGRVAAPKALNLSLRPVRFVLLVPLSLLPISLHRLLTDSKFAREKLDYLFMRPFRLYFNADARQQWLRDMVTQGKKNHIVTDEDADAILGQINEPYIQKYLKSLAVHVCTLPVTQVVSVLVAWYYVATHPEMSKAQATTAVAVILGLFQVTPISPGSICRGLYVVYLVVRERNFKDYNIAVFLGFFKYVGYLAFPIQMAYHYPVLARFMAGHWATGAVHIVPVFGEGGALLEHGIFNLFYNSPLTVRRRMGLRAQLRARFKPRSWHVPLCALAATAIMAFADHTYLQRSGALPELKNIWYLVIVVPLLTGMAVTLFAGGKVLGRRIMQAAICGVLTGVACATAHALIAAGNPDVQTTSFVSLLMWRVFLFAILTTAGAILTEINLPTPPDPQSTQRSQ